MDFIELGAPRQILMLQQMTVAYIALGSNLGDRHAIIEAAIHLIELIPGTRVTQTAACRETAPVDAPEGSPSFINTVSAVETSLKPEELMRHLLEIERDLGRLEIGCRLRALRACLLDGGARVRIVEARDDLVALDALAFLDPNLDDFARDFRGHRRLAAGNDVARGVEDRARAGRDLAERALNGYDTDRNAAGREQEAHGSREREHDERSGDPRDPAWPRLGLGGPIYFELLDERGFVGHKISQRRNY